MDATATAATTDGAQQVLGGPVWVFAQFLILLTIGFALYMLVDTLRPKRRAQAAERVPEPLWIYTLVSAAFLLSLIVVQLIPGLQVAAAVPSLTAPVVTAVGFAYLLRVVFPRPTDEQIKASERKAEERAENPVEPEDYTPFGE